jgi:hypothetical protein
MSIDQQIVFQVDPGICEARQSDTRLVNDSIDAVTATNLQHHYSGPICAQRWLDVCQDPEYGHRELVSYIADAMPQFLASMREEIGTERALSLVSLGPGDGAVDREILRHMDQRVPVSSYWGFDSSVELLCVAVRRIADGTAYRQRFPIRAVYGDFCFLRRGEWDKPDGANTRLFCLTGFTLGNFAESELLFRIKALMRSGDYLFLDARTHELGAVAQQGYRMGESRLLALQSYTVPSVKRFVFGPLEVMTRATVDEVDIELEVARTLTTVPNALNIVIFCKGLDTVMRFTERRFRRDRVDLAMTTLYRYEDLKQWLINAGFTLVRASNHAGMAFFLLRRNRQ